LERFRKLNRSKDKYEQLASILLLGRSIDAEALLSAVDWANRTGSPTFDSVRFYLASRNMEADIQNKTLAEALDPVVVEKPRLMDYDTLFVNGGDDDE
jgi:hypothetical protein